MIFEKMYQEKNLLGNVEEAKAEKSNGKEGLHLQLFLLLQKQELNDLQTENILFL